MNEIWYRNFSSPECFFSRDYYFIDDGITRAGYYEYRIIARHYDGGFSQMSSVISININ